MKFKLIKKLTAVILIVAFGASLTGCANPLFRILTNQLQKIDDNDYDIDYDVDSDYSVDFDGMNENSTASPEVQEMVATITSSYANNNMNSFEKAKAMHDWLVSNVDYVITDNCHTAYGALIEKQAVCDGYSYAYRLLMSALGFDCRVVYGYSEGEAHAWNVVNLDGVWYQMDVTWDDPLINGMVVKDGSNVSYDYFLLNDEKMYADHTVVYDWNQYDIPECTSTAGMDWIAPVKEQINSQYNYDYNYDDQYGYDLNGDYDFDYVGNDDYSGFDDYLSQNSPYWYANDEVEAFELAVSLIENGYSAFTIVLQPYTYGNDPLNDLVNNIIEGISNGNIETPNVSYSSIYYGSYSENGQIALTIELS